MFIAVDVGTSFIKGAVLNPATLQLEQSRRLPVPDPLPGLPPLWCEFDPYDLAARVKELIISLLPHAPGCAGVVMCGQMGGLVLTNARGEPLSNYISWLDKRLLTPHPSGQGTYFDQFLQHLSPDDRRRLGNEVRPGLLISFLYWLAQEKQLPPGEAIPAVLPDFIVAHLCQTAPTVEPTGATGAINLETLDWPWPLLTRLGLDRLRWPAIRAITDVAGYLPLGSTSLPCYTPVGDHQAALAGAFLGYEELSLNISTGSQASLLTSTWQPGNCQTRPFFDGRFLNTVTHIPAGRALNVLLKLLTELAEAQQLNLPDPWAYIAAAAEQAGETDLELNLAFFAGPVGAQGAISHITEDNLTVGHLFRAAFQNMADIYLTCALRLSPTRQWRRLVYSGGLAQKFGLLRRFIGDKFQVDDRLCASSEDTMLGLLALALVIGGRATTVEQAVDLLRQEGSTL